jgi:hypothetical protein
MKRFLLLLCLGFAIIGCQQPPKNAEQTPPPVIVQNEDPIKRGEYLVHAGACHDCHTPLKMGPKGPEPDMTWMLAGHPESLTMPKPPELGQGPWAYVGSATNTAYAGPWGISYAINLTPDENTGMGIWTEEMFVKALRTGKHFGTSRPILPPMPWQSYSNMTDEDLKAMYAYLRSIPPIRNKVPDPVIVEPPAQP